jgi:acetyl-CoA carboxylase biotin carboxylase subunit
VTRRREIRRVLVANRGEIAVRVIRACRDEGIVPVVVYSDPDATARHVRMADAAVRVGEAAASSSYLQAGRVIDAARATRCDAVHPGYGFLSENEAFAAEVEAAGLAWIGPPPAAIAAMGDKARARACAVGAGVPVVPGTEPLASIDDARRAASTIGYPVLIKAVAGGGGKGMRRVMSEPELESAFAMARSEARSSFGDDAVYIEKFLARPHHVEIQVFGGPDGRSIHLGERDCSTQRRHQKLIEESPSPLLDAALRDRMGRVAVAAADAVGYIGAGTCEFLVDPEDRDASGAARFHFLEMNTRLQVEHPVTELVTGVDLVRWQLRVARGEPLPLRQEDMRLHGHAIECRVYAEDPARGFAPSPGMLTSFRSPEGPGIRVDSGVEAGDVISIHYDPMIAKLLAWGADRTEAVERMQRALRELVIGGVATSVPFHRMLLDLPAFRDGAVHVNFVDAELAGRLERLGRAPDDLLPLALALAALEARDRAPRPAAVPVASSAWRDAGRRDTFDRHERTR